MERVKIGTITKTQGLKGEFRVKLENNYLSITKNLSSVFILDVEYHIKKIVDRGGFFVFGLQEFNNINQIEKFINQPIYANVDKTEKSSNFVGLTVCANNQIYGEVIDHNNFGASDVLTLDNGKMIAIVPNLIEKVNEKNLIVNEQILKEVIV